MTLPSPINSRELNAKNFRDLFHLIADIEERELTELSRKTLGEILELSQAIDALRDSRGLLLQVEPSDVSGRFRSFADETIATAREFLALLFRTMNYSGSEPNAPEVKRTLTEHAQVLFAKATSTVGQIVAIKAAISESDYVQTVREEYKQKFDEILEQLESDRSVAEGFRGQAEAASAAAQVAAGQSGVTANSKVFLDTANGNRTASYFWLFCTVTLAIAFIPSIFAADLLISRFAVNGISQTNIPFWVSYLSSKFLVLGTIAFLISLARKNFLVSRHNDLVNRHRSNALETYEALVEASGTSEGKELILGAAANCIFSHQDTNVAGKGSPSPAAAEYIPRTSLPINPSIAS